MLDMRARTTATNNTNNEYIVHLWHFDFWGVISFFTDLAHGSGSTLFEGTTTFVSRGGKVANVSSLDESGCERWEITTAEWGRRLDRLPWLAFLCSNAVWEFVDKPEDVDTEDFADDTASYNDWSNVLVYDSILKHSTKYLFE